MRFFSENEKVGIFERHSVAIDSVFAQFDKIEDFISLAKECYETKGKILWCGNGGSAADCQHMAAELMVRYKKDRCALASIALTTDSSILTAHSNDFEFETVFSRQIEALGRAGDILVVLTTSGSSKNIINAISTAKSLGLCIVVMTSSRGVHLKSQADIFFEVCSEETARIQEAHTMISHIFCEGLDRVF